MEEFASIEARMKRLASETRATYIPAASAFCAGDGCRPYVDGTILYMDSNHLSLSGQKLLAQKLLVPVLWPGPIRPVVAGG